MSPLRRWLAAAVCSATMGAAGMNGASAAAVKVAPVDAASGDPGASIYLQGVLPSGDPVVARREAGLELKGAMAACINCHRRSGLGSREGRSIIPPIAAAYLFHPRAHDGDDLDLPYIEGMRPDREPYTEATLAAAIREGVGSDGNVLSPLMPRYVLDDAAMQSLIGHLGRLAPRSVPGVSSTMLHFATIVTPDADPVKRDGMLEVLRKFFEDKNRFTRGDAPAVRSAHRMMFKVNRHWQLHVWNLTGPPQTWESQLRAHLAAEPVFAVISGIGGKTWAPVHRFCAAASIPCLFPNVDLPVVAEEDFYSLYLTKGVLLDAQLIGQALSQAQTGRALRRVIQLYRADDVGEEAAAALAAEAPVAAAFVNRRLEGAAGPAIAAALRDVGPGDAVVLWLRPGDMNALRLPPSGLSMAFASGRMGGLDRTAVPDGWRDITRLAHAADLHAQRRVRMDYPQGWFRIRQIAVVDEPVQADTYLACGILADTINHLADAFIRDYLVERIEGMLEHRLVTGYYPRLALAPHQRFASKGGYIARYDTGPTMRLVADGDWLTP